MRIIIAIIFLSFFSTEISSQDGGARLSVGVYSMNNRDAGIQEDGFTRHSGYFVNLDARLMSGYMSFILGGRYAKVQKIPMENVRFFEHDNHMSLASIRGGLDFNLVTFGSNTRLRTKFLGVLTFVFDATDEEGYAPGYEINDGWAQLVSGIGLDIGPLAIDLEVEYGIVNAYFQQSGSKYDAISLGVGFFF